ncbi:MAG TPA: S8 family serine peptidase [Rhodanobacteraceae bacterium]|nr:S8 family serine peptidase [Rhodanobacteraceae bacterium]
MADAPLAARAAARMQGLGMTAPEEKRAVRRTMLSADGDAYLQVLDTARANLVDRASRSIGRSLAPREVYRYASNGLALELSADEAQRIAALPGVTMVRRERILHVHTDAGPQWLGANQLWNGQVAGVPATKGEGAVVGVIDTGINPGHPSFAATGGDGYTAANPRGHFYGLCATGQAQCNAKLIGIYDFTNEGTKGTDSTGHGSHTAGIAAGNAITDALQGYTVALPRNVSGVAPHANLITYKACDLEPIDSSSDGTCAESALVAAIDQATADQVDVINFSIGGGTYDPYELLADPTSDVYAMFQARAAGVVVVASAGNDGPDARTLGEPGNAPWVIGVANASHNRRFANSLGTFSGAPNPPATLTGQGYTSGYGPAAIVYAGNYGNALCGVGDTQGVTPNGGSNPFAPGTFHGEIVICDRGTYARVEKGYNVKAAGAGGYILANTASDGESIISDDHFLPAVHLGYADGQQLKAWVASAGAHGGTISGVTAALSAAYGDILDASSSRGPYGFGGGILKPDITAPGDNILSSTQTGNGLALLSGTSMSSPHVAGSVALVLAAHPGWSPAQVESALIGTALANSVREQDGVTLAPAIDAGSGRAQPAAAAKAGLYLPLNANDYFAGSGSLANPAAHGDLRKVNRPGLESEDCPQHCTFTRTVADMSGGGTWQVSTTAATGAAINVTPSLFTLTSGASQALNINVDVSDPALAGSWVDGRVVLHKTGGGSDAGDIALTIAVYASPGAVQPSQLLVANAPGGSTTIHVSGLPELPKATFTTASLAPAVQTKLAMGVDPAPGNVYGTFPGPGKQFVLFPNVYNQGVDTASYGRVFIVEIASSDAPSTRLFAGIDSNGNGQPDADEQTCATTVQGVVAPVARCVVDLRHAGAVNVWVLVEVPSGNAEATYTVSLSSGIPALNILVPQGPVAQQLHVVGPGHVPAEANFPLRLFWGPSSASDASTPLTAGTYYSAILIDAAPGVTPSATGSAGIVPLSITRNPGGDDVADVLFPGLLRTFDFWGPETLQHMFIDVPQGAASLEVDTDLVSSLTPLSFTLIRTDFPPSSASSQVAAAPAGPVAAGWSLDSISHSRQISVPASPGRWYVVSQYNSTKGTGFSLSAKLTYGGTPPPTLTPGNYFDPQRPGHGIFISQAGGQQVVDWYTYLEDGTPTWYVAQDIAPAPSVGTWTSTLYRVTWDGGAGTPTPVGDMTLTATAADRLMFSWHLYGQTGSEAMQLLAAPACVSAGGSVNLNGEWYPPAQPGYGFDALALPDQQFDAFYMYDDTGNPRWVVGSNGPFAASSTVPMVQSNGFCPLCAYVAYTTQPAGDFTVKYTNATQGHLTTAITLGAPLSGAWNIDQPITRLTGVATCP